MAGRPERRSDEEILAYFADCEGVLTTTDVREHFDYGQSGMWKRLNKLAEKELIDKRKSGNQTLWWLTDEGRAYLDEELDTNENGSNNH